MKNIRILIVEDEFIIAGDVQIILESLGYTVIATVSSGEEAVQKTAELQPDLVLMDIVLTGDMDGIAAADQIRDRFDVPVVFLTAHTDRQTLQRAMTTEPFGYVLKPFEAREVFTTVEMTLHKHKMESKLRESEEKYRLVVENVNEAIVVAQDGMFKFVNHKTMELTGYSQAELASKPFADLIHPDDREMVVEHHQKILHGDELPHIYPFRIIDKGDNIKLIEINAISLTWEGRPVTVTFLNDITERKRTEEALRKSRQLLEKTFASLRDAIFIIDADTVEIVNCNPAASEIFGYSNEEMVGQTTSLLHVDAATLEEFREHLYPAVKEKGFLFLPEFRMKRKDGAIFPTEHSVMPLEDDEGKHLGWVSVVHDITERQRAEEALMEERNLLRTIYAL